MHSQTTSIWGNRRSQHTFKPLCRSSTSKQHKKLPRQKRKSYRLWEYICWCLWSHLQWFSWNNRASLLHPPRADQTSAFVPTGHPMAQLTRASDIFMLSLPLCVVWRFLSSSLAQYQMAKGSDQRIHCKSLSLKSACGQLQLESFLSKAFSKQYSMGSVNYYTVKPLKLSENQASCSLRLLRKQLHCTLPSLFLFYFVCCSLF